MGFKINRVYTRSGDSGETSLVDGSRVPKDHPRCAIYGGFDEISCHLGLAKDSLPNNEKCKLVKQVIEYLQQELFDLGAELACPKGFSYPDMWRASEIAVTRLEDLCDYFNKDLPELSSFILPGGSNAVGHLHVARVVTRRVERDLVSYSRQEEGAVSPEAMKYCNRLSDLIFILCRYVLHEEKITAPTWQKESKGRAFPLIGKR